ncbi:hypothetical protein [Tsukamurella sp. NPDC003166]|uniref:hypothetical protein n=1 Tax=Tsukamurella sp. NPDC003166 TaxID=3154444 RepID=UPI0033AD8688
MTGTASGDNSPSPNRCLVCGRFVCSSRVRESRDFARATDIRSASAISAEMPISHLREPGSDPLGDPLPQQLHCQRVFFEHNATSGTFY